MLSLKTKELDWTNVKISSTVEPVLTDNARVVLDKRYLAKDDQGTVIETPRDMFERVARYIASADFAYNRTQDEVNATATLFYEMMARLEFMPNSPTLMNAGRALGQLSACFVLPVEDSMDKIFDSIKNMALIHKSGGGTGFSFSRLRPKNDVVRSTAGISSGPVSFMNIFNAATETIKQGGTRRGANMAILNVDHPDILEFIQSKENEQSLTNFNISVAITDRFMDAVENNDNYQLKNPRTGEPAGTLNAREVFDLIVRKAWSNGEPGIIFIDRINEYNPLKSIGEIESTNPCGEQPLLPFESCNLGSINLNSVLEKKENSWHINYDSLRAKTRDAVHFLDNVIDLNRYPLDEIHDNTLANRKIGLGVMGFADVLIKLGISYNSNEAIEVAGSFMSAIQDESKRYSRELARERGAFPNFGKSVYSERGEEAMRNATTTTIAPTGTISIIANASSGIEPFFALAYVRNVLDNNVLVETNPLFEAMAKDGGYFSSEMMAKVAEHGSIKDMEEIPEKIRKIFVTAHDISPEWHIKIQAAFQENVDNAVSKTVNFSHEASVADIEHVYSLAYKLGCKGVTVYRDGSRVAQVLETKKDPSKTHESVRETVAPSRHIVPRPRNEITWGATRKMATGCGSLYVTINEDENGLFEIFAAMGKSGGCAASQTEAVSRLISLALRSGIDKDTIIKQLKGVRCPNQAWEKGGKIYSCADAIAKALERYVGLETRPNEHESNTEMAKNNAETNGKTQAHDTTMVGVCPDCHSPLVFQSGCSVCLSCGFSRCG